MAKLQQRFQRLRRQLQPLLIHIIAFTPSLSMFSLLLPKQPECHPVRYDQYRS